MVLDDKIKEMCCFGFDTGVCVFAKYSLEDAPQDSLKRSGVFFLSKEIACFSLANKILFEK